ncbi:hypothetical protein B7760_03935 [Burkholderia glumae]|nr:DDE domain protein [Burkholderia glumae LMG 2196 = ATCC 33617]QKM49875.1 hypothetical protein B7760_03935 [Burkholderia glumae]QKM56528.1 hypothetical protein CG017_04594 [Burkholderia glumae]QTP36322.1 hypothetical protein B7759_04958 [Burkholderia glumae]
MGLARSQAAGLRRPLTVLLQKQRDKTAAKRFFQRVPRSFAAPRKIVTDPLRSYPAAKAGIPPWRELTEAIQNPPAA